MRRNTGHTVGKTKAPTPLSAQQRDDSRTGNTTHRCELQQRHRKGYLTSQRREADKTPLAHDVAPPAPPGYRGSTMAGERVRNGGRKDGLPLSERMGSGGWSA